MIIIMIIVIVCDYILLENEANWIELGLKSLAVMRLKMEKKYKFELILFICTSLNSAQNIRYAIIFSQLIN